MELKTNGPAVAATTNRAETEKYPSKFDPSHHSINRPHLKGAERLRSSLGVSEHFANALWENNGIGVRHD